MAIDAPAGAGDGVATSTVGAGAPRSAGVVARDRADEDARPRAARSRVGRRCPASSRASQASSSTSRCCGSIAAASRGEMPKKPASKRSTRRDSRRGAARAWTHRARRARRAPSARPGFDDRVAALPEELPVRVGARCARQAARHPDHCDRLAIAARQPLRTMVMHSVTLCSARGSAGFRTAALPRVSRSGLGRRSGRARPSRPRPHPPSSARRAP